MTVCVAVLASSEKKPDHIIMIADTQGSYDVVYSTDRLHKCFYLADEHLFIAACDGIDKAAEWVGTIHKSFKGIPVTERTYGAILDCLHDSSDGYKRERFRYDMLPSFAQSPRSIPGNFTSRDLTEAQLEKWNDFYVGTELIVGTFDGTGQAFLMYLDGKGGVQNVGFPGVIAIGSGSDNASFWLNYRDQNLGFSVKRSAYHALEAKIMGEKSVGVNENVGFSLTDLQELFKSKGPQSTDDL